MVVQSTCTMASVSAWIVGVGTSSQALRPGPLYTSAFMVSSVLFVYVQVNGVGQASREALGRTLDDDPPRDLEGFDADHVEARSARPRFNIEVCGNSPLFGVFDEAGVTA